MQVLGLTVFLFIVKPVNQRLERLASGNMDEVQQNPSMASILKSEIRELSVPFLLTFLTFGPFTGCGLDWS